MKNFSNFELFLTKEQTKLEIALVILVVTIVLSIVDLTVGVANDAVNFLNSSIGSKVSTFKVALGFAAAGILIGVTLSSGMMEIARKGIFNPAAFTLYEVLIIFLATVVTDILLLDFFNTFGIPTSTTVSMVSALTGAALSLSLIHIIGEGQNLESIAFYLNLSKLSAIYVSIVISIIFAFFFGYFGQFISRLIFSFNYLQTFKKIGPLWGSFAFTFILFFISVKGLEGASFITKETQAFISTYRFEILGVIFVAFSIIFYVAVLLKINILRFIVLTGTSALALAFASNDLVNFVGPSLSSLFAYQSALNNPDPLNMKMGILATPVKAQTEFLLFCGFVMVSTLYLSKKSRTVTATEVNLGRQVEGYEAFESFPFARLLVRVFTSISDWFSNFIPSKLREKINRRFDPSQVILLNGVDGSIASFDLIRATVNLTISSALISLGTSLKLPLSTTYVTFIVAMATALADRAWGREYAVYRISGILTVIGGWLLTAVVCGISAGLIALIVYYTGIFGVVIFVGLIIFSFARTAIIHKRRERKRLKEEEKLRKQRESAQESFQIFVSDVVSFLTDVRTISNNCVSGISKFKLNELKKTKKQADELNKKVEVIFQDFAKSIKGFDDIIFESSHNYATAMSDLSYLSNQVSSISKRCFDYVDNSQRKLTDNQIADLKVVLKLYNQLYDKILSLIENPDTQSGVEVNNLEKEFSKEIKRIHKTYMKALKRPTANAKRGIIYISLVESLYGIILKVINLVTVLNQLKSTFETQKLSTIQ
ncbi:MAG: inorganic phosphate transporter [Ignavibacteria bacterium]|nr:inorganic phosphate transporter [Ignavibacteria bacterium]